MTIKFILHCFAVAVVPSITFFVLLNTNVSSLQKSFSEVKPQIIKNKENNMKLSFEQAKILEDLNEVKSDVKDIKKALLEQQKKSYKREIIEKEIRKEQRMFYNDMRNTMGNFYKIIEDNRQS